MKTPIFTFSTIWKVVSRAFQIWNIFPQIQWSSEILAKNGICKNKGENKLFCFYSQLKMTIKFFVQKVGLEKKFGVNF